MAKNIGGRPWDDGFSGQDYIASHRKRAGYQKSRVWTTETRRLYRAGLELLDAGVRIEVVVATIERCRHA